ncbi:MAG: hypothetical protein E7490_01290 [Ruminococcaceae bacterium]|nr:hypothetical protein [Oscillospiraceae bacterium]
MRKLNIIKKVAVLLVFSIATTIVAGCSNVEQKPVEVKDIYLELKCDNELSYNKDGNFSVNISGATEFMDDITSDDVKICYVTADNEKLPQIDSEEGILLNEDEYRTADITPLQVIVNSSSSLTVNFKDMYFSRYRPCGYIFILDKDSSRDNKLLYCYAPVRYSSYSMVSDTAHVVREESEVTLKLTLDKTSFSDKISEKDITLSGGFSSCTIKTLERTGENTLTIDMQCVYNDNSQVGYVIVDKSMIADSSEDVTAEIRIDSPEVITDMDGFEATFNFSCIPVSLKDATFTDTVSSDMVTCDNPLIRINRVDRISVDEAMIYLTFDMETALEAVKSISESNFTISKNALNINKSLDFTIKPSEPDVSAGIISVEEVGSDFKVTAQFSVINGSFNVVSKTSFVFGGDYSKAVVESIQLQDDTAIVEFTIPKTASADTAELYGTVALKSSSLLNKWGENNSVPAFPLRYSAKERASALSNSNFSLNDVKHLLAMLSKCPESFYPAELSKLSNIRSLRYQDGKMLSYYLDEVTSDFIYFDNLHIKIKNSVRSDRITDKNARIIDSRNRLDVFLSNVDMLRSVVMSVENHLDTILQYESADLDSKTPEEADKLTEEYKKAISAVQTVFNGKTKGRSFTELLLSVAEGYTEENNALQCYDYLIDCSYNWQPQTITEKDEFRYYVNSVLAKAYVLAFLSFGMNSEITEDNEEYMTICSSLIKVTEHFSESRVVENSSDKIFCNTLGRSFSLHSLKDGTFLDGITSVQISQLVNKLPKDTTLRDELLSVGFDISDVRYLICSDVNISRSHASASKSEGDNAIKLYTHTSRATVYDLISSNLIEDFAYESYSTLLSSENREMPKVSMLAVKNIELYSLR